MSLTPCHEEVEAVAYLRSPEAVRERCRQVLALGETDRLRHFAVHLHKLSEVATYVVRVMHDTYPRLDIPMHSRWRHFDAGGVPRLAALFDNLAAYDNAERARCCFDLVITSVLLDAGAGTAWRYHEAATGRTYARSEGLAVASLRLFVEGWFSSCRDRPWQADAAGLRRLTTARLAEGLQVTATNPLLGMQGRAAVLRRLGKVVAQTPRYFGAAPPRVGHLFDYLSKQATGGVLHAGRILLAVLESLSPIWPGRLRIGNVNLGDVWRYPAVGGEGMTAGLVPFHKLSQWLTYSLVEPLQAAGLRVDGLETLTGLAEYRNGGLLLDLGLLTPKHVAVLGRGHPPASAVVVEWRALTVAVLERLAAQIRRQLGMTRRELPLCKILEGGTWRAGRKIAGERRADGRPPLRIISDGTVM